MTDAWQIRIYENQRMVYSATMAESVELGRQDEGEAAPYSQTVKSGQCRLVIAKQDERTISRKHLLLELQPDGTLQLRNLDLRIPLRLSEGGEVQPGASHEVTRQAAFNVGNRVIRVQRNEPDEGHFQSLAQVTRPPSSRPASSPLVSLAVPPGGIDSKMLVPWLQATMGVFQSAASSAEFFQKAAQAVVEMVGLDVGRVLLLDKNEWRTQALYTVPRLARQENESSPSRQILNQVRKEKRTFWEVPGSVLGSASLMGVKAVVAAPILDRQGEVIAALYGDRRQASMRAAQAPITELEATLVELLASGVAAGLARLEQEQAALAARVQFEQFFTPELSRQLSAQPDLLKGRDAEVTVLFCDIRGFSRISERLGPTGTVELISDVMGALSECVLAHEGVVVDYIGDELMAMWGAPEEQPDHPRLACRAALEMLTDMPKLNERWQPIVKERLEVGIGINTGMARVGNTGSRHKFKYGPLGNTVNLASRVEGATKYLKTRLLITGATHTRLDASFPSRRLCKVAVVNIAEPVDLYELAPVGQPQWPALQAGYTEALDEFEKHEFLKAVRILGNLLADYPSDGPSLLLLSRAVHALIEEPEEFNAVWKLPGK